jgi:serine protease Do
VEHVGQYNDHAVAKRAGFLKDDILTAFDGKEDLLRETDLFAYVMRERPKGSIIDVSILRKGQRQTLRFKLQ